MFLLAGFQSSVGRLCRSYIRPLFLPPVLSSSSSDPTPTAPEQTGSRKLESKPEPPSTLKKAIYDSLGSVVTIAPINFGAAAFVIGDFKDSLEAWRRMNWYGIWMIGGAMLFFFLGGKSWFRSLVQQRVRRAEKRREEETKGVRVISPQGIDARAPGPHILPPVDLAVAEVEKLT